MSGKIPAGGIRGAADSDGDEGGVDGDGVGGGAGDGDVVTPVTGCIGTRQADCGAVNNGTTDPDTHTVGTGEDCKSLHVV